MALLANEVSGAEAERIGLVNRCVPLSELEEKTRALAKQLATSQRFYQRASVILISVVGSHFKAR
jgi:enoyl-CoA hydratase/carnithine racemase